MGCTCSECTRLSLCPKPYPVSSLDDSGESSPPEVMSKITSTGNKNSIFTNPKETDQSLTPLFLFSTKINEQMIGNSPGKDKNLVRMSDANKSKDSDNGENRALSFQRDTLSEEILIEKDISAHNHAQTSELMESSISVNVESEPNYEDKEWRNEAISGSKGIEQKKSMNQENKVYPKKWMSEEEKRRIHFSSNHERRKISDMNTESLAIIVHDSKDNMVRVVVDTRGQLLTMPKVKENVVPWVKGSPRLPIDDRTMTTDDLTATGPTQKVRSSPRDSTLWSINKQIGEAAARGREKTKVIKELIAENLRYKIRNQVRSRKRNKRLHQDVRGSYRKIPLSNTSSTPQVKNIDLRRVRNSATDPLNSQSSVDVTSHKSSPGIAISRANSDDINKQVLDQPSTFSSVDEQNNDASVQELKAGSMRSQSSKRASSRNVRSPITRHVPLGDMPLTKEKITNMRIAGSPLSEPINFLNNVDSPSYESSTEVVNMNTSSADIDKQVLSEPLIFRSSLSRQKTDGSPKAASEEELSSVNSGQWEFSEIMII